MIYLSSDLHFNHNKEFCYAARGFISVEEMNKAIVENFNSIIKPEDDLYLLGDLMLGGAEKLEENLKLLGSLKGNLHIVRGNHDTDSRMIAYSTLPNVVEICEGKYLKYKKWMFVLHHYPTLVGNYDDPKPVVGVHGHTHSTEKFQFPDAYNVSVDAHNCFPVSLDQIKQEIIDKRAVEQLSKLD